MASHSFSMALPFGRPGKSFFAQAAPGTAAMHHWYLFSILSQYGLMMGQRFWSALAILP